MNLRIHPQNRVCGDISVSEGISHRLEPLAAQFCEDAIAGDKSPSDRTMEPPEKGILQGFSSGGPGDISVGAFWLAWAAPQKGSRMILRHVGLNLGRLGFVDALLRMGAGIREEVIFCGEGEWFGNLDVRGGPLRPIQIEAGNSPSLIDEIPILAVLAAKATGVSSIRGAASLRGKEIDRISAIVANLKSMGVDVAELPDGMVIQGSGHLRGAEMDSFGDQRIAMAFTIAGLLADEGHSVIQNADCIDVSCPQFRPVLLSLLETTMKNRVTARSSHEIESPDAGIAQW